MKALPKKDNRIIDDEKMDNEDQQALSEVRTRLQRPNESYRIITANDIKTLFGNFITKEAE